MAWLLFHGCPVSLPVKETTLVPLLTFWQSFCFFKACPARPMAAIYGRMRGNSGKFSRRLAFR
jgi:hypothetical protein